MARYHAKYESVEALQYDGTRESALAIAAAFPGKITRALDCDVVVAFVDFFGQQVLREVPAGSWLVRRSPYGTQLLELVSDEHFTPFHTRLDR